MSYWHHGIGHHHHHAILLLCFVLEKLLTFPMLLILEISHEFLIRTGLMFSYGPRPSMLPTALVCCGILILGFIFVHLRHKLHHRALRDVHHLSLHLNHMSPHLCVLNQEQYQTGRVYQRQHAHAVQNQPHLPGQLTTTSSEASAPPQLTQRIQHPFTKKRLLVISKTRLNNKSAEKSC